MQERHVNRALYFKEQEYTVDKYVLPFIEEHKQIDENSSILEIGCGEGGNLIPFFKRGCKRIVGIDLAEGKINNANTFFQELENEKGVSTEFICKDIYDIDPKELGQFDLIITRDVIEHIHDQDKFMGFVKEFMKDDGMIFFGFPPWYNPFGGHQQICQSKWLSKLPYFHILPKHLYKFILKAFGETDRKIADLIEIKDTGISLERFERIVKKYSFHRVKVVLYFINPNYEIKFKLKPRVAWRAVSAIPFFRNFMITAGYYLLSKTELKENK